MEIKEMRELLCESGKRLVNEGLVAGTWGNISMRVDAEHMLMTPTGAVYNQLTPDDMVLVKLSDLSYEGSREPSSEKNMHAAVYINYPVINVVIHNHSLFGCIVSTMGKEVPPLVEDMVQIIGPTIKVVPLALTGTPEMAEGVVKALDNRFGAVLENHGSVCAGRDMEEAFTACRVLEKSCEIAVFAQLLGGGKPMHPKMADGFRDYYLNHYQKR